MISIFMYVSKLTRSRDIAKYVFYGRHIDKKLCYCRETARRATSVEILWPFFD